MFVATEQARTLWVSFTFLLTSTLDGDIGVRVAKPTGMNCHSAAMLPASLAKIRRTKQTRS